MRDNRIIKAYLANIGISQSSFAAKRGMSQPTLSRLLAANKVTLSDQERNNMLWVLAGQASAALMDAIGCQSVETAIYEALLLQLSPHTIPKTEESAQVHEEEPEEYVEIWDD